MNELQRMLAYSQKHAGKMKKFGDILKQYLGIENFWYAKTTQNGKHGSLELNFSHQEFFFENQFHTSYPLIRDHQDVQPGYFLYPLIEDETFQNSLLTAENKFEILPVLGSVKRVRGNLISMGYFVNSKNYLRSKQYLINNLQLLDDFQEYFIKEMSPIIHKLDDFLFDFRDDIKDLHPVTQGYNSAALTIRSNFLEELHGLKKGSLTSLTCRETEVMKYLQLGLTAPHIGLEMNISCRTAEHHMENIKLKLNCDTKSDLIKYAQFMDKCDLFSNIIEK